MLKFKNTAIALSLTLLLLCGCSPSDKTHSTDNGQKVQWLSNNYTGFDYSRGQLNISGDETAVTASSPCETTLSCKLKPLFSEGSFDLLCGYTDSPIYYEITSLAAPTALSGVIFRITEKDVTLLSVDNYRETTLKTLSFTFGECREVAFGKMGERVILKIDGEVLFEEKVEGDFGSYYGFGVHDGAILRVYGIAEEETP
ncbi:MAG: hypothetical protein IJ308_09150 [Clostridia bacterium]|nr:hypothetical protein [Clostridia bacterium]MBQ7913881.1 hypothetical protein [Clostridia bacterium]